MGALLFYDSETTGLPLWHDPSNDPGQPHVIQLTALLTHPNGSKISSMDCLIQPPGEVDFSDEAVGVHGITPEMCAASGIQMRLALPLFLDLWKRADLRIGHSESFDARMVRIEMMRHGPDATDMWKAGKSFCTMQKSVNIVKVPPTDKMMAAGRKNFKNPTLAEAYEHFTGSPLGDKAHNAMFDVMACKAVYFAMMENEHDREDSIQSRAESQAEDQEPSGLFGDD